MFFKYPIIIKSQTTTVTYGVYTCTLQYSNQAQIVIKVVTYYFLKLLQQCKIFSKKHMILTVECYMQPMVYSCWKTETKNLF